MLLQPAPTPTRPLRTPRPAVLAVTAAATLAAILAVARANLGDIDVYRTGGRAVLHGGDLYGFALDGHGFTYPPFAALLLAPFAVLPAAGMWLALNLLSVVALVTVLRLSAPADAAALRGADRRAAARAAARLSVLVLALPVVETFRFGQVDLILAALVMLDVLVLRRGVLLGLAAAVKLTPGVFIAFLLVRGRYREALTATAVFAASVVLPALVLPREARTYWLHDLAGGTGTGGFTGARNQSLHGLLLRLGAGGTLWPLLAAATLVGGLLLARAAARLGEDVLAVGVVGVTGCLVSPLSWNHHWVWVLPALAGLWRLRSSAAFGRWLGVVGAVLVAWTVLPPDWQTAPIMHVAGTGLVPLALVTAVWVLRASERAGGQPERSRPGAVA